MSLKHVLTILSILLIAVLVVGLILCRPMSPENYASGVFNFEAVSDVTVSAWEYDPQAPRPAHLLIKSDDSAAKALRELFEDRGFGRTPGSILSDDSPEAGPGDICWSVTFHCTISQSTLTAEYTGGTLRLTGDGAVTVTTQNKDAWARQVYDLIVPLYPEPEHDPEAGREPSDEQ